MFCVQAALRPANRAGLLRIAGGAYSAKFAGAVHAVGSEELGVGRCWHASGFVGSISSAAGHNVRRLGIYWVLSEHFWITKFEPDMRQEVSDLPRAGNSLTADKTRPFCPEAFREWSVIPGFSCCMGRQKATSFVISGSTCLRTDREESPSQTPAWSGAAVHYRRPKADS